MLPHHLKSKLGYILRLSLRVSLCTSVVEKRMLLVLIPDHLKGLAWIFPMKYAARVITINEFGGGITFSCSENDIQSGVCTAATGEQVLDLFGFHESTNWLMGAMVAITFAYRVFAWGVLALRYAIF
jgi:hypothetical protein